MDERAEDLKKQVENLAKIKGKLAYIKALGKHKKHICNNLYFMLCGDAVKIGASNVPEYRLDALQTGNPMKVSLIENFKNFGHKENYCHKKLFHLRLYGEWFRYTEEVEMLIEELKNEQ